MAGRPKRRARLRRGRIEKGARSATLCRLKSRMGDYGRIKALLRRDLLTASEMRVYPQALDAAERGRERGRQLFEKLGRKDPTRDWRVWWGNGQVTQRV